MSLLATLFALLEPWLFLLLSASHLPSALTLLIYLALSSPTPIKSTLSLLFHLPSRLRSLHFSHFWRTAGPYVRASATPRVVPLLQGRVRAGKEIPHAVAPALHGTVLEVGAGTGMWAGMYTPEERSYAEVVAEGGGEGLRRRGVNGTGSGRRRITRVLAVEPNHEVHEELAAAGRAAGLRVIPHTDASAHPNAASEKPNHINGDHADSPPIYEIVGCGIEDLAVTGRVARGKVDCVVAILCLCGIPEPEKNIRELYGYLRPGGRMYVYEHVRYEGNWAMRIYQALINIFWPRLLGRCNLQRDTGKWLREAGPWSKVDLAPPVDQLWHSTLPKIIGILTK